MNLILLQQAEARAAAESGGGLTLPPEDRRARHVAAVLRPRPGASVRVGVLGGGVGRASVEALGDGSVRLAAAPGGPRLDALGALPPPPGPPRVELLLAMPRPKVLMRLWSQIAQLGVRRVVLINACRVEKPYFSSRATDPERFRPELLEGLEQAVCTRLPEVRVETRLKPFVEDGLDELCPPGVLRLLCHPGPGSTSVAEAVAAARTGGSQRAPPRGLLLAIGPEGGWVDYELELLRRRGFAEVSMGPRVFSTDVALVALVTLAVDALVAGAKGAPGGRGWGSGAEGDAMESHALIAASAPTLWSAVNRWLPLQHVTLGALCFVMGSVLQRYAAPVVRQRTRG